MNFLEQIKKQSLKVFNNSEKEILLNKIILNDIDNFKIDKYTLNFDFLYTGSSKNFVDLSNKIDLLYNVLIDQNHNIRNNIALVKTYSNVRGSHKKPRAQKGTGRSRQGRTRSSIVIGGIKIFGPKKNKKYDRKINKKCLKLAFNVSLVLKYILNNFFIIKFFNNIDFSNNMKTNKFVLLINKILINLGLASDKKILFISNKKFLYYNKLSKLINNVDNFCILSINKVQLSQLLSNNILFMDINALEYIKKKS